MSVFLIWLAAGFSALICGIHIFAGGMDTARPVRENATLDTTAKLTALLAWHYMSATLAMIAVLFAASAVTQVATYAAIATGFAAIYALIGIIYPRMTDATYSALPQGIAFVGVVLLGGLGLLL